MSRRLRALLRLGDTLARFGGDEFAVILEDVQSDDEASAVAERMAKEMETPFVLGGREVFVTASVGIALGDAPRKQPADLLRDADLAMYAAKHSGKAHHKVFEEQMNTRAVERLELGTDLRRAFERNEFVVHYQPEVALETGEIVGFEALVRWQHPSRGLLLPTEFIPLAEETGLIVPIGQLVLEEACRQLREWHERYPASPPLKVSVNVSPRQFRQLSFYEDVARVLRDTGSPSSSLELEITESVLNEDAWFAGPVLRELKALGVRIAIDDFGTGHSSLSRLKHLPVDVLKVDRSFVAGLGRNEGDEVLVSGIIDLASGLGLDVVVEGVETPAQLEQLREMGCEFAQGFHFSRPLEKVAASEVLMTQTRLP